MPRKDQADQAAAARGLGDRVSYHLRYRTLPLRAVPLLVLLAGVDAGWFGAGDGFWPLLLPVVVLGAIGAYVLAPVRLGVRGVGVYEGGLVLADATRVVAIPWSAVSRVTYRPRESHTTTSGALSRRSTIHVQYAQTQIWLRDEQAPVTLVHFWGHKQLFQWIQACINSAQAGDTSGQ